jgi:hypothetical protein
VCCADHAKQLPYEYIKKVAVLHGLAAVQVKCSLTPPVTHLVTPSWWLQPHPPPPHQLMTFIKPVVLWL